MSKQEKELLQDILKNLSNANVSEITLAEEFLIGKVLSKDIFNKETGEVLYSANTEIDNEVLETT